MKVIQGQGLGNKAKTLINKANPFHGGLKATQEQGLALRLTRLVVIYV